MIYLVPQIACYCQEREFEEIGDWDVGSPDIALDIWA